MRSLRSGTRPRKSRGSSGEGGSRRPQTGNSQGFARDREISFFPETRKGKNAEVPQRNSCRQNSYPAAWKSAYTAIRSKKKNLSLNAISTKSNLRFAKIGIPKRSPPAHRKTLQNSNAPLPRPPPSVTMRESYRTEPGKSAREKKLFFSLFRAMLFRLIRCRITLIEFTAGIPEKFSREGISFQGI